MKTRNPHFVAYSKAHGKTPKAMLDHDRKRFLGGSMCGFMLWMAEQKKAFFLASPHSFFDSRRYYAMNAIVDLKEWGRFLDSVADAPK